MVSSDISVVDDCDDLLMTVENLEILGLCYCVGMKADKGQFDEVLRRMLEKPPQKTSDIRAKKEPKKAPPPDRK